MQATPTVQPETRVPSVDDLRVKLCFICREEERYDSPEDPPRAWTHPCSLDKAAQQDPARARNALKCPQCGASYELESDNPHPRVLRILDHTNALMSIGGKVVMIGGLATVVVSFGFGLYLVCTTYGAHALQSMVGREMYDILLTDEPDNWPWHAFINLPMIPISLILSRSPSFSAFPLLPLIISWPSSHPVLSAAARIGASSWSFFGGRIDDVPYGPIFGWPPSPMMASLLFPLVGRLYRTQPAQRGPLRNVVWDLGGDGPMPFRARIGLAVDPAQQQQQRQQQQQDQDQQGAPAPAQGAAGQDQQGNGQADEPGAAAERTLRITNASLGRFIGGALLMPTIASYMGSVLYRLSKFSPTLRTFLAIRPPLTGHRRMSFLKKVGMSLHVALSLVCGGTRVWYESDPVWWRNSIGLGLFIVAKDCMKLLHLYLAKRDLETRRVKSRSFVGVDLKELDLIHPPTPDGHVPVTP
ncbi:uncharacterized protein B0H18DRAFT_1086208 [Fomitopsis serialis]|uniref:uncharacterized protein n=1 Tax=Fomitopsis serialis TaxID=139415 RepID=UPI002007F8CE|nr:uncharacterized protein B0H18DRAFT_1086208 [Neoantrodia serialis]KAH9921122.1 hypothetical protein B0H18DRAFT_1086208 [Neoantrodia serialis]